MSKKKVISNIHVTDSFNVKLSRIISIYPAFLPLVKRYRELQIKSVNSRLSYKEIGYLQTIEKLCRYDILKIVSTIETIKEKKN